MKETIDLILVLASAGFLGIVVGCVYKLAHSRAVMSSRMVMALIIYSMIPAMMLYEKFHVGGIAVISAVTVMRFRNPVKDHRDLVYILWSVVGGFSCAAHQYFLLAAASIVMILVLLGLDAIQNKERILLVVRGNAEAEKNIIESLENQGENHLKMRYNNSMEDSYTELIYEIRNNCDDKLKFGQDLKNYLYRLGTVTEVNLLYQSDDMSV